VGKAEYLPKGENPRFIVTSLSKEEIEGKDLYEKIYCARGDMENRIKEQQLLCRSYIISDDEGESVTVMVFIGGICNNA
jgi:hypothetical protein